MNMSFGIKDQDGLAWYYADGYEDEMKEKRKRKSNKKPFWKFW